MRKEKMYENDPEVRKGGRMEARKRQKVAAKKEIRGTLIYMIAVFLIVMLVLRYVGQRTVVDGDSMETTLTSGENLIMDKLSYRFHDPKRFDIVIFPGPVEDNGYAPYYIKRVIGMPGETVQIKNNKVWINGEELAEDVYSIDGMTIAGDSGEEPYTLEEDEYFCLGDNRPVSYDSRYMAVGPVSRDELIGKVWIRIWPVTRFGPVE